MGRGVPLPGVKQQGVKLTTHLHLVPRLRMSKSYISAPLICHHGMWHVGGRMVRIPGRHVGVTDTAWTVLKCESRHSTGQSV